MLKTMCILLIVSLVPMLAWPTNAVTKVVDVSSQEQALVESQADVDEAGDLAKVAEEDGLIDDVSNGIVRAIEAEKCAWYECGTITPPEEYMERARRIAKATRTALLENGLIHGHYLWGAVGIIMQESRGNPCPFGPYARQWAIDKKLVKNKHMVYWNTDDALHVMHSMLSGKVKRSGVDSGVGQTIWPRNSKIREETGQVRTATPEEMVTVEGGARALAYYMQQNAQLSPTRPWAYWPGVKDELYGAKIEWWVHRMHGPNLGLKARWQ